MIYAFYGNDTRASREKLHALVDILLTKRPHAEYFHITPENKDAYSVEELLVSQGLFEKKYIIVFDGVLEAEGEKLLPLLKDMKISDHAFIFIEATLDAKTKGKLEKHAGKIQEFQTAGKNKVRFNIFSLTDALGERDRVKLWVLFHRAKKENVSGEEIHGILFWQAKNFLLARNARGAKESGLNPFVYKKASSALRHYSEGELRSLAKRLMSLSHDARRGMHTFDIALERFILNV